VLRDLTTQYISFVIEENDPSRYEKEYPSLFAHYHRFWSGDHTYYEKNAESIKSKSNLIFSRLPCIQSAFARIGLNTNDVDIILFVGNRTSNGHAFYDNGKFVVWIPVETYSTQSQVDIFVTHEIIHALHYWNVPEFYFHSKAEQYSFPRQIITEGIATYLTSYVLGCDPLTALWADYLSTADAQKWYDRCETSKKDLYKYALDNFNAYDPANSFFTISDSDDVMHNRGGYYVGLKVIQHIIEQNKCRVHDLLIMNRQEIETKVYAILKNV